MATAPPADINQLFNDLKLGVQKNVDISQILKKLAEKADVNDKVELNGDALDQINAVLRLDNAEYTEKAAEIVATFAKKENHREFFSDTKLIVNLCQILRESQTNKTKFNFGVVKQTCRALGNLCYENDTCRKAVHQNNGLKIIIEVVRAAVALANDDKGADLRHCSVGLLLNFVAGYEDLDLKNVKEEMSSLLCDVLDCGASSKDNEAAAVHCLIILGILADIDGDPILNQRLSSILVKLLKESTSGELVEFCVELMHSQSEYASVSLNLAKAGLCELLIQLLEKHKSLADDVDTRNLFKMACDLIIIILNNDESMYLLFENGNGKVYHSVVNWLSSNVEELQVSGVLAVVNFARADSHCIEMVKQGIDKKLMAILSKNNTDKGDIKLQHALLSALRNLVIPDQNKSILIKNGLLETLYPVVNVTSYPVVFKLLGTLRIVVDKQEKVALELGCKKNLILKTVEWSSADHPGVQGEANRFLAWLIKNSKNQALMDIMIECKAVPKLVEMIVSEYEVMQNEALLAVTILSTIRLTQAEKILVDSRIGEKITRLVKERKPKKEVFSNVLSLVNTLCASNVLKQHLKQSEISASLADYVTTNTSAVEYKDEVARLTKLLEGG